MSIERVMRAGRMVAVDTRLEPLFGGTPAALNTDPPVVLNGTGLYQGLPDTSILVRPLSQFNNSGASDDAGTINDALGAAYSPRVRLGPWTYNLASTVSLSPGQYLICDRKTVINYTGSGDAISMTQTTYETDAKLIGGGVIGRPTIDGKNAGTDAAGLHVGDIAQLEFDVMVQNFNGTGQKGVWFDNRNFQCEQMHAHIFANYAPVVFDNSVGYHGAHTANGSFDRGQITVYLQQDSSGDGVVFQGGAFMQGGRLSVFGNQSGGGTTQRAVLRLTGSNSNNSSYLTRCVMHFSVECDSSSTLIPYTIYSAAAGNDITYCTGLLDFSGGVTAFTKANGAGKFIFQGTVQGDTSLSPSQLLYPADVQTITANGQTITTANQGLIKVAPGATSYTGMIMEVGEIDGQMIWLLNTSSGTLTFAALATSNVADGTSDVVPALGVRGYIWNGAGPYWQPVVA